MVIAVKNQLWTNLILSVNQTRSPETEHVTQSKTISSLQTTAVNVQTICSLMEPIVLINLTANVLTSKEIFVRYVRLVALVNIQHIIIRT